MGGSSVLFGTHRIVCNFILTYGVDSLGTVNVASDTPGRLLEPDGASSSLWDVEAAASSSSFTGGPEGSSPRFGSAVSCFETLLKKDCQQNTNAILAKKCHICTLPLRDTTLKIMAHTGSNRLEVTCKRSYAR